MKAGERYLKLQMMQAAKQQAMQADSLLTFSLTRRTVSFRFTSSFSTSAPPPATTHTTNATLPVTSALRAKRFSLPCTAQSEINQSFSAHAFREHLNPLCHTSHMC
jgi:hypothetical protein